MAAVEAAKTERKQTVAVGTAVTTSAEGTAALAQVLSTTPRRQWKEHVEYEGWFSLHCNPHPPPLGRPEHNVPQITKIIPNQQQSVF